MYIKRFFILFIITLFAGCSAPKENWFSEYGNMETGKPAQMQYGTFSGKIGTPSDNFIGAPVRRMAVLLPLSGDNEQIGKTIRTSIETAVLQNAPQNLSVSFYDTASESADSISEALANNPEIIIGPVFSKDAAKLRSTKPDKLPALSFTSDATAIGDGVMTMALMPTNSIEAIVKEMSSDGIKKFIVIAPETSSGKLMAGTAISAGKYYDISVIGIFYYTEQNSDSIKNMAQSATMNTARVEANNRAREILSDILTNERLTAIEKSSLTIQLEKLSKKDTLGKIPYDGILFLGNSDDTKNIVSFLRYYGLASDNAKFYGTAVWDGSEISKDITMSGAKYAALPEASEEYSNLYEQISGEKPTRLATFGYDATNMAIGMLYSDKSNAAYLLNPSGYIGIDGLFRLKPTGENERALRIIKIKSDGTTETVREAQSNFLKPIYNLEQKRIKPAYSMELATPGVNPNDYIYIPERFHEKYKSKTYGATITPEESLGLPMQRNVIILPDYESDAIISPDFKPVPLESVNVTYIDSIEIEE